MNAAPSGNRADGSLQKDDAYPLESPVAVRGALEAKARSRESGKRGIIIPLYSS
jgi:hypothetical protein